MNTSIYNTVMIILQDISAYNYFFIMYFYLNNVSHSLMHVFQNKKAIGIIG